MSNIPIVKPVNVKEYEFKQSRYEVAPRLPFSQIITGPSGSGKGILLQSMILDIYKDVFAKIYVWSPSISVDANWLPSFISSICSESIVIYIVSGISLAGIVAPAGFTLNNIC